MSLMLTESLSLRRHRDRTLRSLVEDVQRSKTPSITQKMLFEQELLGSAELIIELIGIDAIRSAWIMTIDEKRDGDVVTRTRKARKNRSGKVVSVTSHIRQPPKPLWRTAATRMSMMLIDGIDIRDLTIGRCKTLAKHKTREAKVLRAIARECRQISDHITVREQYTDEALARLIRSAR
jgi:hypothetical protein